MAAPFNHSLLKEGKLRMKQYILSVYDDGTIKLTERAITKRDCRGRFAPNKKRVAIIGEVTCPNCGAKIEVREEVK